MRGQVQPCAARADRMSAIVAAICARLAAAIASTAGGSSNPPPVRSMTIQPARSAAPVEKQAAKPGFARVSAPSNASMIVAVSGAATTQSMR